MTRGLIYKEYEPILGASDTGVVTRAVAGPRVQHSGEPGIFDVHTGADH